MDSLNSRAKKNNHYSYTTNNNQKTQTMKIIDDKYIKLPKLKTLVRIKLHRQISKDGIIKSATISKNPSNKYYISILVKQEINKELRSLDYMKKYLIKEKIFYISYLLNL